MKKLFLILVAAAAFTSCSKDRHDDNWIIPMTNVPKYKTVAFPNGTTTYSYDQYGRQILEAGSDGSKVETSYLKGKVFRKIFNASGVNFRTITIELDTDGRRTVETYSDKPGNFIKYEYNQDKTLAKSISKSATETIESIYFYANGNMDSTQYYRDGVRYLTNTYTYYLDQPLVQLPANIGVSWYAADKKNMMKTLTHQFANGNAALETYVYDYDSLGRLVTLTETTNNGVSVGHYTYY